MRGSSFRLFGPSLFPKGVNPLLLILPESIITLVAAKWWFSKVNMSVVADILLWKGAFSTPPCFGVILLIHRFLFDSSHYNPFTLLFFFMLKFSKFGLCELLQDGSCDLLALHCSFGMKVFQAHLVFFLSQIWSQPFLQWGNVGGFLLSFKWILVF